jgi:large subunit ribosomal protein L4
VHQSNNPRVSVQGSANTKTRAEVSGGGRKPYQQKGTGRARQGSIRTPLKPGGGVVFGPKPKDWSITMNRKEKQLAMATALQSAAADIVAVDSFGPLESESKTRKLLEICRGVGVDPMEEYTLIVTAGRNAAVERCGKNVRKLLINSDANLRVYDVLRADKIIFEEGALQTVIERFSAKARDGSSSGGASESSASEPAAENAGAEEAADANAAVQSAEGDAADA